MLRASRTYATDQSQEEKEENEHLEAFSSEEPQSSSEQPPINPITDADHPRETQQLEQEDAEAAQPNAAGIRQVGFGSQREAPSYPPSKTIYVGNMDFKATSADLGERCSAFGKVLNVRMVTDARGLSKG